MSKEVGNGVSVGYFDTEDAAARAYDRAAIGLLGRQNCRTILNFPIEEYDHDSVPELVGKSREEVKATLKSERAKMPRRRLTNRRRTSRYLGVGSSNRKNQWQARILYHGKVTHLGYYRTEEEAARVYDKVSISLHGAGAQTNFPIDQYKHEVGSLQQKLSGLTREQLQRALGVKPMDKSSKYRGVSKKKGRWEAKVMLNRKWAYREMFDTEVDAARAYDTAVWRLKPREAAVYANFKDTCPPDVAEILQSTDKDQQLALHPTGLPLTAKPLIDAGLLFDDEGQSIRGPNGITRRVSIGDLVSLGDSAGQSASEDPSAGNASGSGGQQQAHSSGGASGGATGAVAGGGEGVGSIGFVSKAGMVKSASYSALSGLDGAGIEDQHHHPCMRVSRSCGNLAFMASSTGSPPLPPPGGSAGGGPGSGGAGGAAGAGLHSSPGLQSTSPGLQGNFSSGSVDFTSESKPLMVRVGSEQHLINPTPTLGGFKGGMTRIASESHLASMVPVSPSSNFVGCSQFVGPERGLLGAPGPAAGATAGMVNGGSHYYAGSGGMGGLGGMSGYYAAAAPGAPGGLQGTACSAAAAHPGLYGPGSGGSAAQYSMPARLAGGSMKWETAGDVVERTGSPMGNIQIGGEDLDVTMAFLADSSPRRLSDTSGLADFLTDPVDHVASPTHSNSGLLYDTGLSGLGGPDPAVKMDEC
eukprot:gene4771-5021_t